MVATFGLTIEEAIMNSPENQRPDENSTNDAARPSALPLRIGSDKQEVERLIGEISETGVAQSGQDVERTATPGPETGEDR
jgi:hypothetical protein